MQFTINSGWAGAVCGHGTMMASRFSAGFGWCPDIPDGRDLVFCDPRVRRLLRRLKSPAKGSVEDNVDLREFFVPYCNRADAVLSPVDACLGLMEYFESRRGRVFRGSPEFVAAMAQRIAAMQGGSGISIRTTMKAIRRFGIPPQRLWDAVQTNGSEILDPSLFAYRRRFRSLRYFRLDDHRPGPSPEQYRDAISERSQHTLENIKSFLQAGFPVSFGFSVPASLSHDADTIEYRGSEQVLGGQATVAVGYEGDQLLIRSGWGSGWGDEGYGQFPFHFVIRGYATDFWSILKPKWLTHDLRCPTVVRDA